MTSLKKNLDVHSHSKLISGHKSIGTIITLDENVDFYIPLWEAISGVVKEKNANFITFITSNVLFSPDLLNKNETVYKQINAYTLDGLLSFDFSCHGSWTNYSILNQKQMSPSTIREKIIRVSLPAR
jgi:hypothetical protein